MSSNNSKQYGLILAKSKQKVVTNVQASKLPKPSVFGNDSSSNSEDDTSTDWMKKRLQSSGKLSETSAGHSGGMKKQAKLKVAAALAEDPTVYQYDEVYEQMEEKKQEENAAKNADKATKKPRYIQNMIKNAERQKRENERRIERQVQKDREAEGEQFADKEKFVTSAYRKKMEENAKLDEEEEHMDRIEKALDVKGQKDMSGFYRHLYRQTMGEEKGQKSTDADADEVLHDAPKDKPEIKKVSSKKREYRKRDDTRESDSEKDQSTSSSESDDTENIDDNKQKTVDAQENEEINEKEIEQQKYHKEEARRTQLRIEKEKRDKRKRRIEMGQDTSSDETDKEDLDMTQDKSIIAKTDKRLETDETNCESVESDKKSVKKQKVDIWKKVTIGDVFEAALQRYLIRKQSRTTWP